MAVSVARGTVVAEEEEGGEAEEEGSRDARTVEVSELAGEDEWEWERDEDEACEKEREREGEEVEVSDDLEGVEELDALDENPGVKRERLRLVRFVT